MTPASSTTPQRARRLAWLGAALWGTLALTTGAIAFAVMPACGIALPGGYALFDLCPAPAPESPEDPDDLRRLALHQQALRRELDRQRLRLADAPACPQPPPRREIEVAQAPPDPPPAPAVEAEPPPLPPQPVPEREPEPESQVRDPPPEPPLLPPRPVARPAAPPRPPPPPAPPQPEPPQPEPDPPPPAVPPPPPDDRLRIPEDVDRTRDLAFLAGCWRTDPFRHTASQGSPGVSTYCFDANGRGRLSFRRDGIVCDAPARVEILPGGRLRIWDADTLCNDGRPWYQDRLDCAPRGDGVAQCSGESTLVNRWTVNLHRI